MYTKNIVEKLLNKDLEFIFKKILSSKRSTKAEIRFIGGAVRDLIINNNTDVSDLDIDLATNLLPEEVKELFLDSYLKFIPTGIDFGTITLVANKKQYQITTLRKDVSTDGRHAKVEFSDSWEEDAARRDFTINAISLDIDGKIHDYFDGINDLNNSVVKFIGDPAERIKEDNLRIIRYYRFCSKFINSQNLNSNTRNICRDMSFLLKNLSVERVHDEFSKICSLSNWRESFNLMLEDKIISTIMDIGDFDREEINRIKLPDDHSNTSLETIISFLIRNNTSYDSLKKIFYSKKSLDLCHALINFPFKDAIKNGEYDKFFYYTNKYFLQFLIFYSSIYNLDINYIYKKYANKIAPIFPISGKDLINIGYKSGVQIGNELKELEKFWINSNFNINKNDLLQIARNVNEKNN